MLTVLRHIHRYQGVENGHSTIERKLRYLSSRQLSVSIAEDGHRCVFVTSEGLRQNAVVAGLFDRVGLDMGLVQMYGLGHDEVLGLFRELIGRSDDEFTLVALLAQASLDLGIATELGDVLKRSLLDTTPAQGQSHGDGGSRIPR